MYKVSYYLVNFYDMYFSCVFSFVKHLGLIIYLFLDKIIFECMTKELIPKIVHKYCRI